MEKHTKVVANRLAITSKKFGYIISLVCAKQLVEPMRISVTCPQGSLRFKKKGEIIQTYKKADELTQSVYAEVAILADEFSISKKSSEPCGQHVIWNNILSEIDTSIFPVP